jgi:hypothetical protein
VHLLCRWLGVDHVFLTDNNSTDGGHLRAEVQRLFPLSFLTVKNEFEPRGQLKVYAWCAEEHRVSFNWIAFFDVDEYLVIRDECAPLTFQNMSLGNLGWHEIPLYRRNGTPFLAIHTQGNSRVVHVPTQEFPFLSICDT